MRITELCFTCLSHARMAADTDKPRDGVRRVWVISPGDVGITVPPGVETWVMDFDRSGNLRGWPCIQGMISAFERAFAEGAEAVIKRDKDTRILTAGAMTDFGDKASLFVYKQDSVDPTVPKWKGFGAAYALLPGAIPILKRAADLKLYTERDRRVPEDDFMSFSLYAAGAMKLLPTTAARFTKNSKVWPVPACGHVWENIDNRWDIPADKLTFSA